MTRRTDQITAEKISLALLSKEAFGLDVGMQTALFFGLPRRLVAAIFSRKNGEVRTDVQGVEVEADRRRHRR